MADESGGQTVTVCRRYLKRTLPVLLKGPHPSSVLFGLSSLNTTACPVFIDVLLKNQPEGVQLSVQEHTEADFHARFKGRPELEGLMAQMGN